MNVLHVLHAYSPSVGGIQWLFQNVSERLVRDWGDQVTVYTTVAYDNILFRDPRQPVLPPGETFIQGVRVRRFPVWNRLPWLRLNAARVGHKLRLPGEDWLRGLYFGPVVPGLAQAVAASGADLVVASAFPLLHMHAALRGARQAGVPIIFVGALHPADAWCYDRKMIYQAIRQVDAYIALSAFERDYLIRRNSAPRGDPECILVIGGGVDAAAFVTDLSTRDTTRQRLGWASDDPVVAFVGRHAEHKRLDVILAAMQRVWRQVPRARLLIAGARSEHSARVDEMVTALLPNWRARVTRIENFGEAEKPALLAACDVLVNPSSYESFGIVFLEAWACAVPVIGARIGAIPTVIDEGQDGLLAAYDDADDWARAIVELLADPARRTRLGAQGQHKVRERYTWNMVTRRFRETYEKLIKN